MSARSHRNRYRVEPFGTSYEDVLQRGKSFHDSSFMMVEYGGTWGAYSIPVFGELPKGAIIFTKDGKRWKGERK